MTLTQCRHDLHQDYRLAFKLTWNTFRDHLILEYEISKYDADLRSLLYVISDNAWSLNAANHRYPQCNGFFQDSPATSLERLTDL